MIQAAKDTFMLMSIAYKLFNALNSQGQGIYTLKNVRLKITCSILYII